MQFESKSKAPAGYGPRIIIRKSEIDIPHDVRMVLKDLSCWKGNTSNEPSKYYLWEFSTSTDDFKRACDFLRGAGFEQKVIC